MGGGTYGSSDSLENCDRKDEIVFPPSMVWNRRDIDTFSREDHDEYQNRLSKTHQLLSTYLINGGPTVDDSPKSGINVSHGPIACRSGGMNPRQAWITGSVAMQRLWFSKEKWRFGDLDIVVSDSRKRGFIQDTEALCSSVRGVYTLSSYPDDDSRHGMIRAKAECRWPSDPRLFPTPSPRPPSSSLGSGGGGVPEETLPLQQQQPKVTSSSSSSSLSSTNETAPTTPMSSELGGGQDPLGTSSGKWTFFLLRREVPIRTYVRSLAVPVAYSVRNPDRFFVGSPKFEYWAKRHRCLWLPESLWLDKTNDLDPCLKKYTLHRGFGIARQERFSTWFSRQMAWPL